MQEIIILIVAVLLAVYNGQFIKNKSKEWHRTGWFIRALLMFALWPNILLMLIYFNLAWIAYDIIINIFYLKAPWHYQGNTSFLDKNLPFAVVGAFKVGLMFFTVAYIHYKFFSIWT